MIIGSHVRFNKEQLLGSLNEALSYGANAFMLYTGAPHNTVRSEISEEITEKALKLMDENGIDINNVICHAPYIINLANKLKEDAWEFSINFLKREIRRCEHMGIKYIVVHPGNAMAQERNVALLNISEAINRVLEPNMNCTILLETMAGKGTECGKTIEELKFIIDHVELKDKIGICIDSCHINDAGYKLDKFLEEFDEVIGIDKIKCVHLNDSKNDRGTHKDRHENIGFGYIGFDNIMYFVNHPKLKDVPKILETPYIPVENSKLSYPPYKFEIAMIKENKFDPNLKEKIVEYYK